VPAVIWYALQRRGVHVLTANDYLAGRDAAWMGRIYERFGLSVACLSQLSTTAERRAAYACDVLYATANEVGFDYLRDGLAFEESELVQRSFGFAVIDEVDSILIDEARIPLVIAGGEFEDAALAHQANALVISLRDGVHYRRETFARNVQLTDSGIRASEAALGCGNLFDRINLPLLTAVQNALHAHALLRRDVDYVVADGAIQMVDEFKGRVAPDRRWPEGLQTAVEAKEHLTLQRQGRILGSITVQNLTQLYEGVCGMTGTAATQAEEFWKVYRLPVTVIPTNRPVIRQDLPDVVYADKRARNRALVEEIRKVHATGRPILVGTASVEESERLSAMLDRAAIPHTVLNARNNEAEAEIVAQAGAIGAVTISTNMAGRGTDILLGGNPPKNRAAVQALGGLYVIGTTRHEARRIDHQLRGRAGRQGDPGTARFFISLQDDLLVRFGIAESMDVESAQRTAESQNIEIRQLLWKYESLCERHRQEIHALRREVLLRKDWSIAAVISSEEYERLKSAVGAAELETTGRRLALAVTTDLWADYLANVSELRSGVHWVSWAGRDPLHTFLKGVQEIYSEFHRRWKEEIEQAFVTAEVDAGRLIFPHAPRFKRGATWTYLTTDQPFGTLGERIMKGLLRRFVKR